MNIKHRVHRVRYIDWNTLDDDFELYADELMSDATHRRRKRNHQTDIPDPGKKGRERHKPRPDKEPDH